jgi:hypothetical protein
LVGPEKVYVHFPAEREDSLRLNDPSGVLPSGEPVVFPLGSVTQRLMAVPVGSPEVLTTYVCPTAAGLGLMVQGGSFFAGLAAKAAVAITAAAVSNSKTPLAILRDMILLSVRLRRGRAMLSRACY